MGTTRQQRNVEVAVLGMEAYNRGQVDALIELLDPEVEVYTPPTLVNTGTYRGHEGFAQWIRNWEEAWESFELRVGAVEPLGDRFVLVDAKQFGEGRGSGVPVELEVTYVYEINDDRITYLAVYPDRESAVADAREREADA